jgi:hypothetical protein
VNASNGSLDLVKRAVARYSSDSTLDIASAIFAPPISCCLHSATRGFFKPDLEASVLDPAANNSGAALED